MHYICLHKTTVKDSSVILNNKQIGQKINRIAHEIYEYNYKEKGLVLVGIDKNGYLLAQRIADVLKGICKLKLEIVRLKIDKDNPLDHPVVVDCKPSVFKGANVMVVDDVLNSGRTLIYAVRELLQYEVRSLNTVVLVNRRHRQFPIRADYVGLTLSTTIKEHVDVVLAKGKDAVYLH